MLVDEDRSLLFFSFLLIRFLSFLILQRFLLSSEEQEELDEDNVLIGEDQSFFFPERI